MAPPRTRALQGASPFSIRKDFISMTSVTDSFPALPEPNENIAALWNALSQELAKGSTVTFTVTPAEEPRQLALVQAPEPADDQTEESIPEMGYGILFRAAARLILRWEAGGYREILNVSIDDRDIEDFWIENREAFKASCDFAHRFTNNHAMERTPVAAAHYVLTQVNGRQSAEAFLMPLGTGANLERHSPALTLTNKLVTRNLHAAAGDADKPSNETVLVMLVRAYTHFLNGGPVTKLRWPTDWVTPPIPRIA